MMKSYQNWQKDEQYRKEVLPVVEWSFRSLFRRKMGDQEKGQMERIGAMLGKSSGTLGKLLGGRDDAQYGDDLMSDLNSGNMKAFLDKSSPNSPFRQAYDAMNRIKNTVNKVDPGNLNQEETAMLVNILANAHKGGNIPFGDLKQFWQSVTGVMNDQNQISDESKDLALSKNVHTPLHLLRSFFGIGNGIFNKPSNDNEIYSGSEQLLRQVYPDQFNQLYHAKFGVSPTGTYKKPTNTQSQQTQTQTQTQTQNQGQQGQNQQPPQGTATGTIDQKLINSLTQALNGPPNQLQGALQQILNDLQSKQQAANPPANAQNAAAAAAPAPAAPPASPPAAPNAAAPQPATQQKQP